MIKENIKKGKKDKKQKNIKEKKENDEREKEIGRKPSQEEKGEEIPYMQMTDDTSPFLDNGKTKTTAQYKSVDRPF